jgi:hypothetical protein
MEMIALKYVRNMGALEWAIKSEWQYVIYTGVSFVSINTIVATRMNSKNGKLRVL